VSNPLVAVIGASPGEAGRLFSPEAGQLLDKMLGSIGLSREQNCYLTAAVKCPIPLTGDIPLEAPASCLGFLARELDLLKPAFILCLGRTAARLLLGSAETMERLRGRFFDYQGASGFGIPLLPTYHPEECLEEPGLKRPIWEDLKTLRSRISPVQRVLSGGA
jgi:DNA polymerase